MHYQALRVSTAVRECVHYCLHANNILSGIAKFIAELRNSGDWQEAEIQVVESGVRHVFSGLVNRASSNSGSSRKLAATESDSNPPILTGI